MGSSPKAYDLNSHTCEHLLIALKLPPENEFPDRSAPIPWDTDPRLGYLKRGVDGDVVVAEGRETSRKPDEFYGILERYVYLDQGDFSIMGFKSSNPHFQNGTQRTQAR